ncbi:3-keto-5-aminohexanoate cleavage protein [Sphingomonas canadensis]|uniref:3-keto-5-aminohexanoate cleavage protein n=1 Tax=Sphingomonas canadensis TaxID=1219257 RepID=A0ABW3HA98_9SPHN|nr:3-keto-5-aminohexanoate cleavage protein [Sphingomonas canadensis]MCW3838088.1 3-keto-5-aminohexanoate cleavage protein [Sphingomonas canadensis]
MLKARKTIITCAVTGSIHTPSMSPYLPVTPEEIARESIGAVEAGAAIVHLHARDPLDGRPSPDPELFAQFLRPIREATDAVINISTGGAPGFTMEDRLAAPNRFRPELTSLNMGSINFGVFGLAERRGEWKHEWEKPFLEGSRAGFQSNTFAQIERVIQELHHGYGTRFEYECYDVGHLYTLAHFADRGIIKPPFLVQCIFGILGGIGADVSHLTHMRDTAERLFGDDYLLSCFAIGRAQMPFLATCAAMGGSVRVGLEDSLYIARGQLAESNAQQVTKIRCIVEDLGMEIATPAEAREILALKGGDTLSW